MPQRHHSDSLEAEAKLILEAHWRDPGYCVPNAQVYPWQWLWDSCFHAIAWAALGEDRAVVELESALAHQAEDGFVPHMTYWSDPAAGAAFWGRPATSCISQPPMFGHAIAELARRSIEVSEATLERARAGLRYWLGERRHPSGLIRIVHPWETGCDDSPRWDHWCPPSYSFERWRERKAALVSSIAFNATGSPVENPAFDCASVGLSALVAFNARELAPLLADDDLADSADEIVGAIEARWDPAATTWRDAGSHETTTGSVATLDALLPTLVVRDEQAGPALRLVVDPDIFGGACGPAATAKHEPTYEPLAYWRGAAWPQLSYLCWVAARRHGEERIADSLAASLCRGAAASGFSEYWHPDDGTAAGACPQTWATLAAVVR